MIVDSLCCVIYSPTLENATALSALLWFPENCFAHTATTAPAVVTSAGATGSQATSAPSLAETCRALDTLRNNAQSLSCNRNDQCDTVYCTVTDSTVRAFVTAANLTLLPCNQPPAVRVTATNPSGGVVLDRVISQSGTFSLPQGTTLRVTLNQLTNAIGFGVSRHIMVIASCHEYGSWLLIAEHGKTNISHRLPRRWSSHSCKSRCLQTTTQLYIGIHTSWENYDNNINA